MGKLQPLLMKRYAYGNLDLYGDLIPDVDNTRDIGEPGVKDFRNFAIRRIYSKATEIEIERTLQPITDDYANLGISTKRWKDAHLSGNLYSNYIDLTNVGVDALLRLKTAGGFIRGGATNFLYYSDPGKYVRIGEGMDRVEFSKIIQPLTDNSIDIGTSTLRFKEAHIMKMKGYDSVVIPPDATASPEAGDMYFDAATNTLYIYNGTAWVSVVLS